uniref:Uncharacterized protein n=1 Tax=Ciona savignyi TaxID=51511 RepID=H2YWS9_CIOSA
MWKTLKDLISSSSFRTLYSKFVTAVFQPCLLSSSSKSLVFSAIFEVLSDVIEISKSKSGVLNEPIQSCAQFWLNKKTILLFINGNQKHEPKLSNPNKPFLDHFVQILESSKHND